MLTRIVTAACLLPIVAAVYLGPSWLFLLLSIGAGVATSREAARLLAARGLTALQPAVMAGVALANLAFFAPVHLPLGMALAVSTALAFGGYMALRKPVDDAVAAMAATLACVVYPGLMLAFQVALRGVPEVAPHGATALLVFLYAVVFGNDAAAYFAGRAFGRVALAPLVSPKKTVEGFVGGIVGGVLLGLLIWWLLPTGLSLPQALGYGTVVAVAGVLGDLSKSLLKRSAQVKDSGSLLPGHGGLLDRLDGLLFAAPLLYLLVTAAPLAARGVPAVP